jgi:hypothetical protein
VSDELHGALRARGIEARAVAPIDNGYVSISMTTKCAQEFLTALVPSPIDRSDELATQISGRSPDAMVDDAIWRFEASAYPPNPDSGIELFVIVNIPDEDVPEVVRRLAGHD